MKHDVAIIGGGLGGLECGYILSRAGLRVLVLEKQPHVGGCIQSYRRRGLSYDTGFHYVGGLAEGQSLHAVFKYMGLMELPWQCLNEHFDRVTIGGQTYSFAQGFDAFARTLAAYFPAEKAALQAYVALLRQSAAQQFSLLNPHADASSFSSGLWETAAWQYLQETFHDPLLMQVLSGTSLKMELRRESLPLFTFLHGNSSFIESSWRLKGSGSLVARKLADGIRAQGGTLVCRAEVQELVEKGGKLTAALCANGETYESSLFISSLHPVQTCRLVKQSVRMKRTYRNRLTCLDNTFGMFTVSLRLKPHSMEYQNWNSYIYTCPDVWTFYQGPGTIDGLLLSCRVPEDGSGYADRMDLLTPMMWSRCSSWCETVVGHRGDTYRTLKKHMAEACIDLAERVIPGLHEQVEEYYTSSPLTYRDYTGTLEGAAYGLRKDCRNPLLTILSPRTPVPNLLLTGQSLMLHGIHGVTMTALHTCAEVLGKEPIWRIVTGGGASFDC